MNSGDLGVKFEVFDNMFEDGFTAGTTMLLESSNSSRNHFGILWMFGHSFLASRCSWHLLVGIEKKKERGRLV